MGALSGFICSSLQSIGMLPWPFSFLHVALGSVPCYLSGITNRRLHCFVVAVCNSALESLILARVLSRDTSHELGVCIMHCGLRSVCTHSFFASSPKRLNQQSTGMSARVSGGRALGPACVLVCSVNRGW